MASILFSLYELSTIIYAILIYLNFSDSDLLSKINSMLYTLPVLLYLFYRHTDYNIPHFDIIIILYGFVITYYNPYLFIPFAINIILLFVYSINDMTI
jgi:hypothetical protein